MFSRKLSPPAINGCSLVTSVMSSVLGHNGSCRFHGQLVDMPLIIHFFFSFLTPVDPVEINHDAFVSRKLLDFL